MKKAVNINLGGIIFHIDEDAYEHLKKYLSLIEQRLGDNPEAKEIINDIELRIAELLQERISQKKQSIDISDVEYIISVMGNPEDVTDNEVSASTDREKKRYWYQKKMYRDPDNAIIGGVCSGLGAFFQIDPVILRIIFLALLFFGGFSIVMYLILWIALPAAHTPIQKMEMRGENINVSNIEKNSKMQTESSNESRWYIFFENLTRIIGNILKATFKIITVFIGLLLIIIGISILLFYIVTSLNLLENFNARDFNFSLPMLFYYSMMSGNWIYSVAKFLIIFLPILALIYLGIKLIFGLKFNDRPIWYTALLFWIFGLFLWIILSILLITNIKYVSFYEEKKIFENVHDQILNITTDDTIFVKYNNIQLKSENTLNYVINDKKEIFGKTDLIIEHTNGENIELWIEKKSRGKNNEDAKKYAKKLYIKVTEKENVLFIPSYFLIGKKKEWRAQQIRCILKIPTGKKIYLDSKLKKILIDADVNENLWIEEIPGHYWLMTNRGLERITSQE